MAFPSAAPLQIITLAAYGLLVLVFSPVLRERSSFLGGIALMGVVVSGIASVFLWNSWRSLGAMETAAGLVRVDGFGLFFSFLILLVTGLSILASMRFLEREHADHGEFYALILFTATDMLVMLHTTHLMMMFIGLEVFSISLYVLVGLTRGRIRSVESALKYFLLGAFSSGFMVYGMALLYGASGSLRLDRIGATAANEPGKMLWIGLGLLLIGLFFKIGAVPFHQWVPDVYQGAPTNVTGFMAAATKTAAFAVLLRVLLQAFGDYPEIWSPMIFWLSIATMTVANLVALAQNNIKRLLAFSSISHAGYLLIAVICRPEVGVGAILFYLTTYAFMTIGAFTVAAAVGHGDEDSERGYEISSWAGLGWSRPALGAAMTVFLLSLAGIPPTGGFLGKYVIFQAAVKSDQIALAVIGVLNAVVGAYYYLRIIVYMYMREGEGVEEPLPISPTMAVVMIIAVVGILFLGLAPGGLLDLVENLAIALS